MEKFSTESEYEQISHPQLKNINFFLVNLTYRTPHLHADFEIIQIIEGKLHVKTPEEEFTLGPGEIAVFNPNQLHLLQSVGPSCVILTIQVSSAFCKDYYPELQSLRFESANLSPCVPFPMLLSVIRLCMAFGCSYLEEAPGYPLKCISNLCLIFWHLITSVPCRLSDEKDVSRKSVNERRFRRITAYINRHYTEKITLRSLAEKESLTMSYLSHLFKQEMKMSFQEYVNSLRLDHAVLLLRNTDMSLTDICLESGFSETKYLNRQFRAVYHKSPAEFRQSLSSASEPGRTPEWDKAIQYIYPPEEGLAILRRHIHTDDA